MNKLVLLVVLFFSTNLQAQFFEGAGNSFTNFGYIKGGSNYITGGSDYAIADFLSIGIGFAYSFDDNLELPLAIEMRADFNAGYIYDLKKINLMLGYHNNWRGSHGAHTIFQYGLSDFFGLYGRANYYFIRKDGSSSFSVVDTTKFNIEAGIIVRFIGAGLYGGF